MSEESKVTLKEMMEKYGVKKETPRIAKLIKDDGYLKIKDLKFPFAINYIKEENIIVDNIIVDIKSIPYKDMMEKYGVKKETPKIAKLIQAEGYSKIKSKKFPFGFNYVLSNSNIEISKEILDVVEESSNSNEPIEYDLSEFKVFMCDEEPTLMLGYFPKNSMPVILQLNKMRVKHTVYGKNENPLYFPKLLKTTDILLYEKIKKYVELDLINSSIEIPIEFKKEGIKFGTNAYFKSGLKAAVFSDWIGKYYDIITLSSIPSCCCSKQPQELYYPNGVGSSFNHYHPYTEQNLFISDYGKYCYYMESKL